MGDGYLGLAILCRFKNILNVVLTIVHPGSFPMWAWTTCGVQTIVDISGLQIGFCVQKCSIEGGGWVYSNMSFEKCC